MADSMDDKSYFLHTDTDGEQFLGENPREDELGFKRLDHPDYILSEGYTPEKEIDRNAAISLFTSRQTTPEKARKNLELAKKTGLPIGLIRDRDNQEHVTPDLRKLSPRARDTVAQSPELAVLARQKPEAFSALLDDALGDPDPEVARMQVEHRINTEGYTPTELNELKLLGYVQQKGKWFKRSRKTDKPMVNSFLAGATLADAQLMTAKPVDELTPVDGNPILPQWYQGKKGQQVNEIVQKAVNRFRQTGDATIEMAEREAGVSGKDLTRALLDDKRLLEALYHEYGYSWRNFEEEDLRQAVSEIGREIGVATENYDISRIQPRTFDEDYTDPGEALDIFGLGKRWVNFRRSKPDAERLAQISNNLDNASEGDIEWVNQDLLEQIRALRGASGGVRAIEGVMNAGKFVAELAVTGGTAPSLGLLNRSLAKYGVVKGAGAILSRMGKTAAKQLLHYIPGITADEIEGAKSVRYDLDDDGNIMVELTEKEADEVAIGIFNRLVDQYIELFSEQSGVFFDKLGTSKMIKAAISKVPGKTLRSAVSNLAASHLGKIVSPKWRKIYSGVISDVGLNGILGEYGEEKVGSFIRAGVSKLARAFDTQILNLTEDKVFGTLAEEIETFGQVALVSGVLRSPLIITAPARAAEAARYVDNQAAWKAKFDANEDIVRSPEATQMVYRRLVLPQTAHVDPTDLRELSQSEGGEAILDKLNISPGQLDNAELNGRMVTINLGHAMSALDAKEHAKLIEISTPDTSRSVSSVEDYLEQMTDEKLQKVYEERMDFQSAYNEALSQLALLGRPDSEIRSVAKLLGSMSDFFGARSAMTAAEWIRKVAFKRMTEAEWVEARKKEAALYQTVPAIPRTTRVELPPEIEAEVKRQLKEAEGDATKTPFFKDFFGEWEAAPLPRHTTDDRGPVPSALARASASQEVSHNIAQKGEKSSNVSKIVDKTGKPLLVYHGTTAVPRFDTFRRGDIGSHFGTKEQASNRVSEEDWNNVDGYTMIPLEDAGLLSGYLNIRNPLYIPDDFGDWHGDRVAEMLLYDYRDVLPFELNEDDVASLAKIANSTSKLADSDMRRWLIGKGFDGIVYENTVEGEGESYIIFSPSQFKSADNLGTFDSRYANMYLQTGDTVRRGVTEFDVNADLSTINETWNATITLFENADASTLVHEIEHYAVRMMECLVSSGLADEGMAEDLKKLKSWAKEGLTEDKYQAAISKLDPKKERIPTFDEWLYSEAHEKIARGFEAYVREGKAPKAELMGAFSTMRRLLTQVYRSAVLLNVNLTNDVREIFDEMLATEETVASNSDLAEVLGSLNAGLLGMTQEEVGEYRKLLDKANDQAWQELHSEKLRQLKTLRTLWANDAKALMAEERVYAAWNDIRKAGGIDFAALIELVGAEAANILKLKGLTSKSGRGVNTDNGVSFPNAKPGVHPAEFASKHGYDSIEEMTMELIDAVSPKEFIDSYVSDAVARFNQDFQFTDAAASVEAVSEALDKLSADLERVSGRENFQLRKAEIRLKAEEIIAEKPVSEIVKDNKLVKECKRHSRRIVEAINSQDYLTAADEVASLREKLETLRHKARAEKVIRKLQDRFRKTLPLKRGRMDGNYQDAITDLAIRLGLSNRKEPEHTVSSVIKAYNEAHPDQKIDAPEIALKGGAKFNNLLYKDAEAIYNLVEFLYNEGRDLVSEARKKRVEHRENTIKESVDFMASGKKDRAPDTTTKILTSLSSVGSKLRNILGFAARWDENSVLFREILNPIKLAESQATTLLNHPKQKVKNALGALYASGTNWDLSGIQGIRFPSFLTRTNSRYAKWDAPMVIMACLNMGNARNRQALLNGFGWQESDLQQIAAVLSASDWKAIQQIWDAINAPSITDRLQTVFRNIYHYDLPMEPAAEFDVVTSNGETVTVPGGYFPLIYSGHLAKDTGEITSLSKEQALPEYRRAGFTYSRHDNIGDPVDLSDTGIVRSHLYDVAHYVTHVEAIRQIMPVVRDLRFKTEFIAKEGKPRYDALIGLLNNVADPSATLKGQASQFERWARSAKSALALWGSIKTVAKQLTSFTVGLEDVDKARYFENVFRVAGSPREMHRFVSERSGFMADRFDSRDLDLMLQDDGAFRSKLGRFNQQVRKYGHALAGIVDYFVAAPAWLTVYDTAKDKGMSEAQAIAEADEFVARTQGGTRPMDMSPIQLKSYGHLLVMFFSAPSAGATSATRAIGKMWYGNKVNVGALFFTVLAPPVMSALVDYAMSGDDDEDDFWKGFGKGLMRNAVSGYLVADALMQAVTTEGKVDLFKVPVLDAPNRIYTGTVDMFKSASHSDWQRAIYRAAEVAGALNRTPVVTAYDRFVKMLEDWNEGDLGVDLREEFGHIKDKNK